MSFDASAHRDASVRGWEEAASGWRRSQDMLREFGAPVSRWLIDAIAPAPGQRVLELCAGLGETGLAVAGLLAPGGDVIVSDQAEAMLAGARERASALGLENVEFRRLDAEWIDMAVASVDAVLCRWGYMLTADPLAALTETRRVLRPGGRVALAVSRRRCPGRRDRSRSAIPRACVSSSSGPASRRCGSSRSSCAAAT
jgi:ubiquinone/menaquinone biosynthesis C-methylase UbiE